jgi:tetratricopeptide (TPR) repeat protein
VGVAVLVFSPDSASQIGRDLGLEVEGKAPLDGVAPPPPQQAVIPSATRPDFGSDPIKDRLKRADSNPEDAESVEELVAQADAAAADGRWSEPADQSVVVMLSRLALIDPGNDAIGRLRKQAASELLPAGDKALKDKDWAKAATSFRGVVSIWPDREDAREGLLRALRALGVVHRRDKDYQAALSTADEILNYEPEDLRALLLRAQMLGELDRWEESKDAYAAAKKLKPSSKVARKGYAKAAQKARKQARLRRKKK